MEFGPKNEQWAHIYTDRSFFYFNKRITLGNGCLEAYKYNDLEIRAGTSVTNNPVRIKILYSSGNVGINDISPDYQLDVNGTIGLNGVLLHSSDLRLKKDIKDIEKEKVNKLYDLQAKTYIKLKKTEPQEEIVLSDSASIPITQELEDTTTHIGFIAQELQVYFPELVKEDNDGYLRVNYVSLIPVLVEALKEQKAELEDLKEQMKEKDLLKSADTEDIAIEGEYITASDAFLTQNQPNPFNENTTIAYFLPSTILKATFYIYDMNGKQLKSMGIAERENGNITIYANELNPGMYYYSLIADGQIIGTKQMILTD